MKEVRQVRTRCTDRTRSGKTRRSLSHHCRVLGAAGTLLTAISAPLAAQPASAQGYAIKVIGSHMGGSNAMNAQGQVVGTFYIPGGAPLNFLTEGDQIRNLGMLAPRGVNAAGHVAGTVQAGGSRASVFEGTTVRQLILPDASASDARGINNLGQVVGDATFDNGTSTTRRAFVHDNTGTRYLIMEGDTASGATAINNLGQVVGTSDGQAFLWDQNGYRDLGTLGGVGSMPSAISDTGLVTGHSRTATGAWRAFLHDGQSMHELGTIEGRVSSWGAGVNSAGDVVGGSDDAPMAFGPSVAFLYRDGVMRNLNELIPAGSGWYLSFATAINDAGQILCLGSKGQESRLLLLTPNPAPPTNLATGQVQARQVTLTWDDNSDNETGFAILRRLGNGLYARIAVVGPNTTSHVDQTVSPKASYTYIMRALNGNAGSTWSNEAGATTPDGTAPAPANLTATAMASSQISLRWKDMSQNETGFAILRKMGAGAYARIAVLGPNTTTYTDATTVPNTGYTYIMRALADVGGIEWSNEATVTIPTAPPVAPTPLAAAAMATNQVNLSWTDRSNNETGFVLLRRPASSHIYTRIAQLGPNTTSYSDTTVSPNTGYVYIMRAINDHGVSAWTNQPTATTPAAP